MSTRREELKAQLKMKSKMKSSVLEKIEETALKFEVPKYRQERYELLTLSNIVQRVLTDKSTTAKVVLDLQKHLGIDIVFFQELRLAIGWGSFISDKGIPITARPGNAERAVDLLCIIEEEMGFEPQEDKYSELTQEFLDSRNTVDSEVELDIKEEEEAFNNLLSKFK